MPTRGTVLISGQDIAGFDDRRMSALRRRKIGFVFQFYNLIPNLTVEENVLLPLLLDGKNIGAHGRRLMELLEVVGLADKRRHTPRELSGGQQQRVAIARALMSDPEILFADEPTGNLDSKTGAEILTLLQAIHREEKKTILMVTHAESAATYAQRLLWVQDGQIRSREVAS